MTTKKAPSKPTSDQSRSLESHEEVCAVRYENIEKRLDAGQQKFIRLEAQIWGLYALMIGSTLLGQTLGS